MLRDQGLRLRMGLENERIAVGSIPCEECQQIIHIAAGLWNGERYIDPDQDATACLANEDLVFCRKQGHHAAISRA